MNQQILSFDTMIKFQHYTKLDPTGTRYTEFLEKSKKGEVYKFLKEAVGKSSNLRFEIENKFQFNDYVQNRVVDYSKDIVWCH